MTFHVIDSTNSINNTAVNGDGLLLAAGDSALVEFDGSVLATGNGGTGIFVGGAADDSQLVINGLVFGEQDGIVSFGDDTRVTINGQVIGGDFGLRMQATGANITIGAAGEVSAPSAVSLADGGQLINNGTVTGTAFEAVFLTSGSVINSGTITGQIEGIFYNGDGFASIRNSGLISGGLSTFFDASADTARLNVSNSGTWDGTVSLSPGDDFLTNTGVITGAVNLGDGDDQMDSRNGKILGVNVTGGSGNDIIRSGAQDDFIDGGSGADLIDGGAGRNLASYASSLSGVRVNLITGVAKYGDAAGDTLKNIQDLAGTLQKDVLIGDNAANLMIGLLGSDTLTGNGGNDTFQMLGANAATISGGDGDDLVQLLSEDSSLFGPAFSAASRIDGGAGFDTVEIRDAGAGSVAFNGQTMINVERIVVRDGFTYNFTTVNANVAAGKVLEVDATPLGGGSKLLFDGSAETNGAFVIDGGLANDTFTGGAGDDALAGSVGADNLTGGAGVDTFVYNGQTDSLHTRYDAVHDFVAGTDKFLLDVVVTGVDATVSGNVSGGSEGNDLQAIAGSLGAGHAIRVNATGGSLSGHVFLLVDVNGSAGYQKNADYVIDITGISGGALTVGDFVT